MEPRMNEAGRRGADFSATQKGPISYKQPLFHMK